MDAASIPDEGPVRTRAGRHSDGGHRPFRARFVLALLVLVPLSVFFMVWSDWVAGAGGAVDSLIGPAVAALAVIVACNRTLRRSRPQWALNRAEVIGLYVALVISIGMTASVWDWGASVATVITWPVWNAGPENQWADLILPNVPRWLTVMDRDALRGFFLGGSNPYRIHVLRAWLQPVIWWTLWAAALLWVSLCLNVIVRRRWSQEEQLPFPMTILPLQVSDPDTQLFRSTVLWAGVILSAGIGLLGMIGQFFPAVPTVPTSTSIETYLTNNKPWDALRTPYLDWQPWHIGLSYLMPVDLAFSLIVFNILWRTEYVVTRLLGWTTNPWSGFPYGDQQTIGGYLALMASVLWLDRRYLAQVLRKAVGLSSAADDRREAFSYRTAILGAVGGLAFLTFFLQRGGMGPAVVSAFLILYFLMAMAMCRMRAHFGPPNHEMYGAMPEFALTQVPGTRSLGPRALALLALLRPYMGEQRPNPAPAQLEGLRMAERAAMNARALAWLMMLVVPLTMLVYFWASLHVGYHLGLGTASVNRDTIFVARDASQKLDGWLRSPAGPNWDGVQAIGVGFGASVALMAAKLRFPAWPLHPVAFPLAFAYPIDAMLPAIIAAWLAKAALLRYGGLRAHRRALPFFLGLLIGSAVIGLLRSIAVPLISLRA